MRGVGHHPFGFAGCHADADGDGDRLLSDGDRFPGDGEADRFRRSMRPTGQGFGEDEDELLAAVAGGEVFGARRRF